MDNHSSAAQHVLRKSDMSDRFVYLESGDLAAQAGRIAEAIEQVSAGIFPNATETNGQAQVDGDADRLAQYITDQDTKPMVRIWQNQTCLVATHRHAGMDGFEAACAAAAQDGWPVHVRSTGGTVVPHGPGVLNISVLHTVETLDIDAGYQGLLDVISPALDQLGISHSWGCKDRSFCDGKFNLLIQDRKAAGTAARFKRGPANRWLAHASLLVDCDMEACLSAVSNFERAVGQSPDYEPAAHINIAEIL